MIDRAIEKSHLRYGITANGCDDGGKIKLYMEMINKNLRKSFK